MLLIGNVLGDRCISVINPAKAENKTAESWRGLVARVRHLLLVAYARAITRLEDYVRQQRERRNEPGWSFMKYFFLQVGFFLNCALLYIALQTFFRKN